METLSIRVTGVEPLLLNNPQTVDPFNRYAKEKKLYTGKRSKTDDDLHRIRELDVESKLYFDDKIGVYVPSTWIAASIAKNAFKMQKISKAEVRSCVFMQSPKLKLKYRGESKVKSKIDIVNNPEFIHSMLLKQGQVKIAKSGPIFHDWEFEATIEFDSTIMNESSLKELLKHAAMYGGYGDFRPTFGRAQVEFLD